MDADHLGKIPTITQQVVGIQISITNPSNIVISHIDAHGK
jgi:hypothetical protein